MKGRNRWFDLLPTYATSTTVFLKGSNCTVKFQFCEYGSFPFLDVGATAKQGMPKLLRKTKPLESVPKIESSVPVVPCNGVLPVKRIGCVESRVPPTAEPPANVAMLTKPPKSGFGERLLPVSVPCEMP